VAYEEEDGAIALFIPNWRGINRLQTRAVESLSEAHLPESLDRDSFRWSSWQGKWPAGANPFHPIHILQAAARDSLEQAPDETLLQFVAQRDDKAEEAMDHLYRRWSRRVRHYVRKFKLGDEDWADDTTELVFVQLWRSAAGFDPRKKFEPFLFGIARNVALREAEREEEWSKVESLDVPIPTDEEGEGSVAGWELLVDEGPDPSDKAWRDRLIQIVDECLGEAELSVRELEVIHCLYWEELTYEETAERLGLKHRQGVTYYRNTAFQKLYPLLRERLGSP
jgi:RNA polymerase sigma-70 factor (ECF subfamily)